ncbi:MAG: hypothetical protein ACTSRH_05025 [Promethearchaeota archaeon]
MAKNNNQRPRRRSFSNQMLQRWSLLYKRFKSFNKVSDYLRENEGIIIDPATLHHAIRRYFNRNNLDFDKFVRDNSKLVNWNNELIEHCIEVYIEKGSYPKVSEYFLKEEGIKLNPQMIRRKIIKYFEETGRDYQQFIRDNSILRFWSEDDVKYWIELVEMLGGYQEVSSYLEKTRGIFIHRNYIRKKVKDYLEKIGVSYEDFSNNFLNRRNWTDEDVIEWINLYKKLGDFSALETYLRNERGLRVSKRTLSIKFKQFFLEHNLNYYEFQKKYAKYRFYTVDDFKYWIYLFEKLGGYISVKEFLRENEGLDISRKTISHNIRKYFKENNWDYENWFNEYYSPENERASLVGQYLHKILEYIFIIDYLRKRIKVFYEIGFDNAFIPNNKSSYELILIDYTISSDWQILRRKMYRGYQRINRFLIIVSLFSNKSIRIPPKMNIPYIENVRIMNSSEFIEFSRLSNHNTHLFYNALKLAHSSLYNDDDLIELREYATECAQSLISLSREYSFQKEDFFRIFR